MVTLFQRPFVAQLAQRLNGMQPLIQGCGEVRTARSNAAIIYLAST